MLKDKNRIKFYYAVIYLLIGASLFEFSSKIAVLREQLNDFSSLFYNLLIVSSIMGAMLGAYGLIKIAEFVNILLKSFTEQKPIQKEK